MEVGRFTNRLSTREFFPFKSGAKTCVARCVGLYLASLIAAPYAGLPIARAAETAARPNVLRIVERFGATESAELSVSPPAPTGDAKLDRDLRLVCSTYHISVLCLASSFSVLRDESVIEATVPRPDKVRRLLPILVKAVVVYPPTAFAKSGFRRVIFCGGLADTGKTESGLAIHYSSDAVLLNAECCRGWPDIHHEVYHILASRGAAPDEQTWDALNPRDFRYGRHYGPFQSFLAPLGFSSDYATTDRNEDEAETFAYMVDKSWPADEAATDDVILNSKVKAVREALQRFDPRFDDVFWQRAKSAAKADGCAPLIAVIATPDPKPPDLVATIFRDDAADDLAAQVAAYRRYIAAHPLSSDAYVAMADALSRTMHWQSAFADYDRAVQIDSKSAKAYRGRGRFYYRLGLSDESVSDLTEAIRLDPTSAASYVARGSVLCRKNALAEAIADFDRALHLDPKNRAGYIGRALARCFNDDLKGGIADYTDAILLDPSDPDGYFGRTYPELRVHDYHQVILDCSKAIQLDPSYYAAYINRAEAYSELAEHETAIADFTMVLQSRPDDAMALVGRGKELIAKGDVKSGMTDFHTATGKTPSDAASYSCRAQAYEKLGDFKLAIEDYTRAIRMGGARISGFLIARGKIYEKIGEKMKADSDFARAKELTSDKWVHQ